MTYKVKNTPLNREVLRLQRELIEDLNTRPLTKINLYYYIEELYKLKLKYEE